MKEEMPTNVLSSLSRGGLLQVRQATEKGYLEVLPNGVFDIAYPSSTVRRGRVKERGRIASALTAGETTQCVYISYDI